MMHIIRYLFSLFFLQDIDECDNENSNCSQFCNNTIGSYQCYCEDGYRLDSDEHTCNGNHITSSVHYFEVQIRSTVIVMYRHYSFSFIALKLSKSS